MSPLRGFPRARKLVRRELEGSRMESRLNLQQFPHCGRFPSKLLSSRSICRRFLEASDLDAHCGISDAAAGFAQFGAHARKIAAICTDQFQAQNGSVGCQAIRENADWL